MAGAEQCNTSHTQIKSTALKYASDFKCFHFIFTYFRIYSKHIDQVILLKHITASMGSRLGITHR